MTCALCSTQGPVLCRPCRRRFERPLTDPIDGIDEPIALVAYADGGRDLVAAYKFRRNRRLVTALADALARQILARGPVSGATVVTWVPASRRRHREQGYDQSALLARAVARRLQRPARRLLRRQGTGTQHGRNGKQRRESPSMLRARRRAVTGDVIVIDDVLTTGATLGWATRALAAAGAATFTAAVIARTPPPSDPNRLPMSASVRTTPS